MQPARLQLETYVFEEISVRSNRDAPGDAVPDVSAEPEFLRHETDPALYQVRLTIACGGDEGAPTPYTVRAVVRGLFRIDLDRTDAQSRNMLISNTSVSLLYGAARDFIMTVTARGPFEPLLLPAVFFPVKPIIEDDEAPEPPGNAPKKKAPGRKRKSG